MRPRLGGPRFVDPAEVAAADELVRDERTTEQIAVDAFVELIRLGSTGDTHVLPAKRPAVLCSHHHLLVHNSKWRVERSGAEYALIPPHALDPAQVPIPAPPKSPVARRLVER